MVYGHDTAAFLFQAALVDWEQKNNIKVYYDNTFNKQLQTGMTIPRVEGHIIPADNFSATLSGDHEAFIGMYQFRVVTELLKGTLPAERITRSLKELYQHNKRFIGRDIQGNVKFEVQITSPIIVPEGMQMDKLWVVKPYFEYRADININIEKEDFEYGLPPS